jgi:hypothetical protein
MEKGSAANAMKRRPVSRASNDSASSRPVTDLSTGFVGAPGYRKGDDLPIIAWAVLVDSIYEQMVLLSTPRPSDVPLSHEGGESEPGWTSNLLSAVETLRVSVTATSDVLSSP